MKSYRKRGTCAVSIIALASLMAQPATAQTGTTQDEEAPAEALEEIVVTAQKRDQSLQDVPVAVTAIGSDAIRQSNVKTLSDLAQIAPGLSITNTQSEQTEISLRGVTTNDFGFAVEQSIPIYLDGVYLGSSAYMLSELGDIQRVEVLKGPQGTLFGRNAAGGVVSVTTQSATNQLEGRLGLGLGNYNLRTANGIINLPIVDDKLRARVFVAARWRDGWQRNVQTDRRDGYAQERFLARGKLNWTPSDIVKLDLSADYMKVKDHLGFSYLLSSDSLAADIFNPAASNFRSRDASSGNIDVQTGLPQEPAISNRIDNENYGFSAKLNWDLSDTVGFESLTSYRHNQYYLEDDTDGTEYLLLIVRSFSEAKEVSQEFKLNGKLGAIDWLLGGSIYSQRTRNFVDDSFPTFLLGEDAAGTTIRERNVVNTKATSYGLFGDAIWAATDRLNVTLGIRGSWDKKTQIILTPNQNTAGLGVNLIFPSIEQLSDENGNPAPALANQSKSFSAVTGRFVLDYKIGDDAIVFANFSQGYKSGGFNSFATVDAGDFYPLATPGQLTPFNDERVTNIEVGIKSEWLGGRLRVNASAFRYVWEDLQIQVSQGAALFTINAGKAVGKGFDLETTFKASKRLSLGANLSILDAKFVEDVPGAAIIRGQDLTFSPGFAATLNADYRIPLGQAGDLRANLNFSHRDDQKLTALTRASAYSLLGGRLAWTSSNEQWEVALWGRNITDEVFLESATEFDTLGFRAVRRNEPRTFGIEATLSF